MKAIGIILAGGNSNRMQELTSRRAIAAMPVAGSYRSVDFSLSNMTNSHIQKVAVLTQYSSRSLHEHLNSSKWWDFGRKQGGLYLFAPTITQENGFWYRGTADAMYQNLDFLRNSHEPYVVIASGDGVYKLDYNLVINRHIDTQADITVVVTNLPEGRDNSRFGTVKLDSEDRIIELTFGSWEGQKLTAVPRPEMAAWKGDWRGFRFPDGESFHDVDKRVEEFLDTLDDDGEFLWITHAGVIAALQHFACGLPDEVFVEGMFSYTMVSRFEFKRNSEGHFRGNFTTVHEGIKMPPLVMD